MNNMRNKILMTLALLLTAVTGAWAQSTLNVVEFELPADWATDNSPVTAADLPGFKAVTVDEAKAWTGAPAEGSAMFIYGFDGDKIEYIVFNNGEVNLPPFPMAIPKDQIYKQTDKFFYHSDAITGAWAQSYEAKVFDVPASWAEDNTHISAADLPKDFVQITKDEAKALAVPDGAVLLVYGFVGENVLMMPFENGSAYIDEDDDDGAPESRGNFRMFQTMANATICYTTPSGPKVAWDAATKTGTFAMPGSDVVLTPIYAKAAAFATTGTEPEAKTLLPEAAEGVIAGTDAPLIADGTGIVAFAGESTEVTQGTLMYAIGTSATEAPALTAFSATAPTAKNIPDDGADVLVWYYIQGADAPQGEAATLDNTFSDTEPACLTVQVLTNKFDITLKAANANTIEAGKATVTVGGTAATVTEGKLEGVKMGSEVKVKAKEGYKFRKVEVKKGGLLSIKIGGVTEATIYYVEGETWEQALQNHPTENSAWKIDHGYLSGNGVYVSTGGSLVSPKNTIDPNANYTFQWT